MDQLYVSNKNETVRMFKSGFLEFCSHVHPATPLVLYLPVIGYLLYSALALKKLPLLAVAGLFVLGIVIWTLLEYVIHRYIFHYEPKTRWGRKLHFVIHGVHHDYPQDATRLVMPPALSLPLAVLFYFLFALVLGRFGQPALAGLVFGYVCYDSIHFATHHWPMKSGLGLWLKQYHLRHHYKDDETGYGISSPVWDYVFRTTQTDKEK